MSIAPQQPQPNAVAQTLESLALADGSASHPYLTDAEVFGGRHVARNLADAAHHLCLLHGRQPGVIDHASNRTVESGARAWMLQATDGFATERGVLTRVVVAAGPLPSTPGQAETEGAVLAQHHALDMLAQSDRRGCALGAATALVLDWQAVRPLVEKAATRFGIELPACTLPSSAETLAMLAAITDSPAMERAAIFGAQQLIGQHRGLWDLLEARAIARGEW